MKHIVYVALFFQYFIYSQSLINTTITGDFSNDNFGRSVTVSQNGLIIAIGSPGSDTNTGLVKVFENTNNQWSQIHTPINGTSINDGFGESIALSHIGNIIAIGSPFSDSNGTNSGEVKVYENITNNWVQLGQTIIGENANDNCGNSIGLSADGTILAVAALNNSDNGGFSGQVRIFSLQNNSWIQLGNTINGLTSNDFFGERIALASDGNTLAVGAPGSSNNTGQVRVFTNTNNQWIQLGNTINGNTDLDQFGRGIAIANNGTILAVGARRNDAAALNAGQVKVYENINNNWVQLGVDINGISEFDFSGNSISLSHTGDVLAIGAAGRDVNGDASGQVKIYENQNNQWTEIGQPINGNVPGSALGSDIKISADGTSVIIGSEGFNSNTGQISVFDLSALLSIENQTISSFKLFPNPTKNQFTIQLDNSTELENVNIYNNLGQLVLISKKSVVNTSTLSAGLYVVELETNKGKGFKNLIIQ